MKALKGLMIYIGIVLGIVVGLGLILLCIMYFVPSFRIFGVGVVHYNQNTEDEVILLSNYSGYDEIEISLSSNKISLNIMPTEEPDIKYNKNLQIFGFSTEIIEYEVIKQVEVIDGKLNVFLNLTEPNGWISTSRSTINVYIPVNIPVSIITNTSKGEVKIGSEDLQMDLRSLSVSTGRGNLSLVGIGSGEEQKSLNLNSLNLKTKNGMFDLTSITNITVQDKVRLYADDGVFKFTNLYAPVEITGDGVEIRAEKIVCNEEGFSLIAENGYVYVDVLNTPVAAENTIVAENLSINIDELTGKTAIVTTYGDVEIGISNNYTIIENENGGVTVGQANDNIMITTYMGDIEVDRYYAMGKFVSHKGDIEVNSYGEFSNLYYTEIQNVDGNVKIYNKVNRLLLKTTGRSNVEVKFEQVKTGAVFQHQVVTNTQGRALVYLPTSNVPCFRYIATGIISGEYSASSKEQYTPGNPTAAQIAEANNSAHFLFDGRIEILGYTPITQ